MTASHRVLKKVVTPFDQFQPSCAILMVNMVDPQVSTMRVFLEAIANHGHALIISLADERGGAADQSVQHILPETVATKKMGIK